MRWPLLTIVGITAAVLVGVVHAGFLRLAELFGSYLACDEELKLVPVDFADGFGVDGFSS